MDTKDEFAILEEKLEKISKKGITNYKTFRHFFVLLSIAVLISPAIYPLANPLINPNTPFENYPLPLQQAYAEVLTPQLSTSERLAIEQKDVYTRNGIYYETIHQFNLPEFVYDKTTDSYKDSFIQQNSTHIKLVNAQDPIIFKREDCTFTKYTDANFNTKLADYHSTMGLKQGTNDWTVFNALSLPCGYKTFSNSTGQYLKVYRDHAKAKFDATYAKLADGSLKTYLHAKNNLENVTFPQNSGLQNFKVSFVEVLGNITSSSLTIDNQEKFSQLVQGTQIIWTQSNMTSEILRIAKGSQLFSIDLGEDFADLLAVRVTKTSSTTFNMEIAFGATATTLAYGQEVIADPLFDWQKGTIQRVTTSSSADTNCNSGSAKDNVPTLHKEDSATSGNCRVFAVEFDVTNIPNGSDLRSSQLSVTIDSVTNGINCDINDISNRPTTTVASTLYTDITGGVTFVGNNSFCTTTGTKIIDLTDVFEAYCEANLASDNWCAVGITFDSLTRDGSDHTVEISNPQLTVTYGTSIPPYSPTP